MQPFGPYVPGMEQLGLGQSDASPVASSRSPATRGAAGSAKSPSGSKDTQARVKSPASSGVKSPSVRGSSGRIRTPESRGTPTWVKSPEPRSTPNPVKSVDTPRGSSSREARDSATDGDKSSTHGSRVAGSATGAASRVSTPADKMTPSSKDRHGNNSSEQIKRLKHSNEETDRRTGDSKNSSADYSLRNSLLSAEAAAQSASTLFFPFGMPSPFASPALLTSPFAGSSLFPYMPTAAAAAAALGSVYPPSFFGGEGMFTGKSETASSQSHHSKVSSANKTTTASSKTTTTTSSTNVDSQAARQRRSPHHGGRNQSDTDWRNVGGGPSVDGGSRPSTAARDDQRMTSSRRDADRHSRQTDGSITSRKVNAMSLFCVIDLFENFVLFAR
jgi:hypothetical protein